MKNDLEKMLMALGGRAIDIQSPQEFDIANKRMAEEAYIKGMTDETAMGMKMLGNVFTDMGFSMIGSDTKGGGGKFGDFMRKNGETMGGVTRAMSNFAAMGGTMGAQVEAEGKEVMETPDGEVAELKGPSHEGGGIDMIVPQGTDFYSKRVKGPDGKTMAERKKKREKTISKLEKLLSQNPDDKFLKKTLKTVKENNEYVDSKDMSTMNFLREIEQATKTYGLGGTTDPIYSKGYKAKFEPLFQKYMEYNPDFDINDINQRKALQEKLGFSGKDVDGIFGKNTFDKFSKYKYPVNNLKSKGIQSIDSTYTPSLSNTPLVSPSTTTTAGESFFDKLLGQDFGSFDSLVGKAGDAIGLLGRYKSMTDGIDMVQRNRDGDTPNINFFKDFGVDALNAIKESKSYIGAQQDRALREIEEERLNSITNNRKSARGINTMRALDLASSRNSNKARTDQFNNFSNQMMQILSQQAGLENQQDLRVMQGEQNRDLADRKDRDNYFTQMSKAIQDRNTGMQYLGKDLNSMRKRDTTMNLINQLSKFGLTLDKDGNLVQTKKNK